MRLGKAIVVTAALWMIVITVLHGAMNLEWFKRRPAGEVREGRLGVGFIPVTCHLTCPVTDYINRNVDGHGFFQPMRFSGFAELKEMFLGRPEEMPATFILAPMAIALREQGVKIKIIYLGHRDGTAVVVHKDSNIFHPADLRGKTIAIPGRYANQKLILYRELKKVGLTLADVKVLEMPPPDMPAALQTRSVDAITSGEPFMGQTELDGYGRVLFQAKDVWPGFISCVLAVHESAIQTRRAEIQQLVDGIAASGKWIDQSLTNRMDAARFVAKNYYNQNPRLLSYVLSKPPDRVTYSRLKPLRPDFEEIEQLAREAGMLHGTAHFDDYVDDSFAPDPGSLRAPLFQVKK
ncbi:MAG TPA: ABC transporter substrate-binding protein [Verrucomicrobiota bacterium]|nr:ABC transporter substrate-binding protein [Verrucomicrobiota bacterium]HNT15602.1 ABC transporter substrate-binding protein [Verrucomicrobiota bacterium]